MISSQVETEANNSVVVRQPQVSEYLDKLERKVTSIEVITDSFIDHLHPVTRGGESVPVPLQNIPSLVPLACTLSELHEKLSQTEERLTDLLDRLEL